MSAASSRWLAASIGAGIALLAAARADATRLPPPLRVAIILKALTYDQAIARHKTGEVRVGVVAIKGDAASEEVGNTTLAEIGRLKSRRIAGLKLTSVAVTVRRGDDVVAALRQAKVNVVYLSLGGEAFARPLSDMARRGKVLIVSGEEEHAKSPAGLVAVLRGQKPKIIVNLSVARGQGAQFDARLLRLADVIK